MRALAPFCLMAGLLTGCATSKVNYTPPTGAEKIQNSRVINAPFDAVWDRLVKELSSDFFVINNIDKNSRLINISFSSQRPSDFVDCGHSSRSFNNGVAEQNYEYATAESANFSVANPSGAVFNVRRTTKLEGRSNIYVAPEGGGTNVAVNTKYIVSVRTVATALDGRPGGTENNTFDFSTKQGSTTTGVTCHALGIIENKILDFVGK
jgi:hypothetical protein